VSRAKEAASLGFESVVVPFGNLEAMKKEDIPGLEVHGVRSVQDALGIIF
jgi:hypothetical protein